VIIAVDFDGTCVTHAYPFVGKSIGAGYVLRDLVDQGHRLILWTMRSGKELQDAVDWFDARNLKLFGINSNPSQASWTESPKAYAHMYIDDAALGTPLISEFGYRPFVDWTKVRALLTEKGVLKNV